MSKLRRLLLIDIILEIAFWFGLVIGLVFGLSFAQRKGKELRADIKKQHKLHGVKGVQKVITTDAKQSFWEAVKTGGDYIKENKLDKKGKEKVLEISEKVKNRGEKEFKKFKITATKEVKKFTKKKLKPALKKARKKIGM